MTLLPDVTRLVQGRSSGDVAEVTRAVKAAAARLRTARECPAALDLAQRYDPEFVRTPALELLGQRIHDTMRALGGRLVVSVPPQSGKTTLARWSILRLLIDDPDLRIVFVSYAASLARTSGRVVRSLVETHGAELGISVDREHRDASDWQLAGHRGGMFTCGVGGSLTGRPADVLWIDDPLRNQQDADSDTVRGNLHEWWEAVGRTRLAPGAPVGTVSTRWHEADLSGRLAGEGWPVVNIPALADGCVPDALGRPVGEWLMSTRGTTPAEWEATRKDVGERVWHALYQGAPSPPAGGIFLTEWFDRERVNKRPAGLPPIVVVDPADNTGSGDEAGIIVASTDAEHHIYLGPDLSGHMTTARWVRVALLLGVIAHRAGSLAYEQSLSGLDRSVRDGWQLLHKQARVLRRHVTGDWPSTPDLDAIEVVAAELCHPEDPEQTWRTMRSELLELWPLADAVLEYPHTGPAVRKFPAKGGKQLRMQLAAPLWENRRVSHVGPLPTLEWQLTRWQPGQDSPDRADAAVHAVMILSGATVATLSRPSDQVAARSTRLRQRGGAITRSTRR